MKTYTKISINEKRIFKVAVVGTVSSGKSTLINALAGQVLLPSRGMACTARTLSLLDNDKCLFPTAHILYEDQSYEKQENCSLQTFIDYNNKIGKPISDLVLECNIEGVHNGKTALLLTDTPGTNNANDSSHCEVTLNYLDAMDSGLVLFVLTPECLEGNDTNEFLRQVHEIMDRQSNLRILFVLNKMDKVDTEKDPLYELMQTALTCVKNTGFQNPIVIPTAAQPALLFRTAMADGGLSEDEQDDFGSYFKRFSKHDTEIMDLRDYVWNEQLEINKHIEISNILYSIAALQNALERTGIHIVERHIEQLMLETANYKAPPIKKVLRPQAEQTEKKHQKRKK